MRSQNLGPGPQETQLSTRLLDPGLVGGRSPPSPGTPGGEEVEEEFHENPEGNATVRRAISNLVPPRLPDSDLEDDQEECSDSADLGECRNSDCEASGDSDLLVYLDGNVDISQVAPDEGDCKCSVLIAEAIPDERHKTDHIEYSNSGSLRKLPRDMKTQEVKDNLVKVAKAKLKESLLC